MVQLDEKQIELLKHVYLDAPEALDRLPYTSSFQVMHTRFCSETGKEISENELWLSLTNLRKRGQLPRKGR